MGEPVTLTNKTDLTTCLPFERPVFELERKLEELQALSDSASMNLNGELRPLLEKRDKMLVEIVGRLGPWERVQIARHPRRPQFRDYAMGDQGRPGMLDEWIELRGDRLFGDDKAISTGFARLGRHRFLLIGHRKGRDTKEKLACNFGCAHPEGYRKALQKMKLADRFGLPIVTLINTPGAYPGIGAEERGQAWAIAENILEMSALRVPTLCIVIGEGGSGGALGIGVGDRVLMLEHSYYSVISPEGCAAILWKSGEKAPEAARALRLTSEDLLRLKVVDEVVPEPLGGAHRDAATMVGTLKAAVVRHLDELTAMDADERLSLRYAKLRAFGNGLPPLDPPPEVPAPKAEKGDRKAEKAEKPSDRGDRPAK
ncbi:MAG: acetyl-CoA carboxylase carboxyltransferase subunit alpha [Planctomycetes bacterium]|nr:acetyl-CoA carboxylase carboxyltransferase subunit alpha [Planctomycetota bacterium]